MFLEKFGHDPMGREVPLQPASPGPLSGRRILIVEDEYFLADDIVRALQALGARTVGPFGELREAADAIDADIAIDAAIVDINLRTEMVFLAGARAPRPQNSFRLHHRIRQDVGRIRISGRAFVGEAARPPCHDPRIDEADRQPIALKDGLGSRRFTRRATDWFLNDELSP